MLLDSTRFGEIDVPDDVIIEFPNGLYGFEDCRRFCILTPDQESPFRWLHAVDRPDLAFVVANPFDFFQDYDIVVDDMELKGIIADEGDVPETICIVTIRKQPFPVTMNLKAPLLVSHATRKGCQVIVADTAYSTRQELPLAQVGSGEEAGNNAGVDPKNG